jgi:uncharacterized protein (DUF302 family)
MPKKKKSITPSGISVLVNVHDSHRDKLKTIAQKLRSAGMKVADVFPLAGTIAGEIASADFSKLRDVEGVASVEEDTTFHTY